MHADSVILTEIVDAHEGRAIAAGDINRAYLHTQMDEFILLKLVGE